SLCSFPGSFRRYFFGRLFGSLPGGFCRGLFGLLYTALFGRRFGGARGLLGFFLFRRLFGHDEILKDCSNEIAWDRSRKDAYRVASASIENTEKTSGFRSRL